MTCLKSTGTLSGKYGLMTKPSITPPAVAKMGRRSQVPSSMRRPRVKKTASGTSTTETWYIQA
jgi:hypothetical protein